MQESMQKFKEKVEQILRQHSPEIARIWAYGAVAVVVVEPNAVSKSALTMWGWDGIASVFLLSAGAARHLAQSCAAVGDQITGRWLRRDGTCRVLLIWGGGSLLFNHSAEEWSLEPGSTDSEWRGGASSP